jgi:hypothetical protein
MKGFGFFVGGALLQIAGFKPALWLMAAMLASVLVNVIFSLPSELGKAKAIWYLVFKFDGCPALRRGCVSIATDRHLRA